MFDFGRANEAQKRAIAAVDGPVLITAGPGTGKTFTLVQRAIYLIEEEDVRPEEIMIATFTEKAAKELITRITNELDERGITANINDMYVGTFHSLCLRILKENLEYTRLKNGFRILDSFDQSYLIFQNFHRFSNLENSELVFPNVGMWKKSLQICSWANTIAEEMVSVSSLETSQDAEMSVLGKICGTYQDLLAEENLLDFSSIQTEAYRVLSENPAVLGKYAEALRYIMIDEYQDTNYIQEQLVFLLGENHQNICVVGDDDQGLYRFRGATIRNILEFPSKFEGRSCQVIPLVDNYRSTQEIVIFYNNWMETTSGARFKFEWNGYRYSKTIKAAGGVEPETPTVIKVSSQDNTDEWYREILSFIRSLEKSGTLTDYNQLAFLFNSVKHRNAVGLAKYLEQNGINVYSPRSALFFERAEIKLAIGILLILFPNYVQSFEKDEFEWLKDDYRAYLTSCLAEATEHLKRPENLKFLKWVQHYGSSHFQLKQPTDYAYSGLFYMMLQFEPFSGILERPMDSGVVDLRPSRNLAQLSHIIGKFEYLHGINLLSPTLVHGKRRIDQSTEKFFNLYLRLLYEGGIAEYEDDSEYAPSGCVSFLTIHQSKGMEFPVVIVDSLHSVPRKQSNSLIDKVSEQYFHRSAFEPKDQIKFFDFWRQYYTAFSRAQNLLVLTCDENSRTPSKYFKEVYRTLPDIHGGEFDPAKLTLESVKDVNIKEAFSFTSHITVYETCSLQYKFYRDLAFMPIRVNAMLFGRLVHQTIEDIHRAALRGEQQLITPSNIAQWFEMNYVYLSRAEHTYLAEAQRNTALAQVNRYVSNQRSNWDAIKEAEVNVSLVKRDYIIDGTIDLIRGSDNTVEIVDFKTSKKPDIHSESELLERYRRQLHVYAHLVEQRTGEKVSKMHLYYTGEEDGVPTITFPYTKTSVDATIDVFDDVVHRILHKQYNTRAKKQKTCDECDFHFYCGMARN
ncbi:ATP-dependent helicase [Ancrocorticia populi]|uniref:DNA 3'-5' helicase n=1 Tax=Ancrocorticia populi TaxID=2175228 RepID=A0A2V1K6S3_9ACTO|nr:ATP-dependent DNA helicase [Ancrocorticia populi]PWF27168.1 ATP-dependent helicase [Ancrocorticia populi]